MSESETEGVTAFAAFKKLLGNLGLQEFPCGFGTWVSSNDKRYFYCWRDYQLWLVLGRLLTKVQY